MFGLSPAELTLLLGLVQEAIRAGAQIYDAIQLKQLEELEVKLTEALTEESSVRKQVNESIDQRHAEIEDELKK